MTVMDKRKPHPGLVVWVPNTITDAKGVIHEVYQPILCDDTDQTLETIVGAGIGKFNDIVVTREVLWKLTVS